MKMYVYSVYDCIAEDYAPPFVCRTDGAAVRQFQNAIENDPAIKMYGNDLALYRIGLFDPDKGILTPLDIHLVTGNVETETDERYSEDE